MTTEDRPVTPPCPVCEGWGAYCDEHRPVIEDATEALRAAIEHMESHVLSGFDWLGTGSSQESADDDEREAWEHWAVIRAALASPEPTPATTWSGKASNVEELRVTEEWPAPTKRDSDG